MPFNNLLSIGSLCAAAIAWPNMAIAYESLEALIAAEDNRTASVTARQLQADPNIRLVDVLAAMKGLPDTKQNWLLSVAQSVADRNAAASKEELAQFLPKRSESPVARFWAFDYLTRENQALREQLLASMLTDPSLELRYEAVALGLKKIDANSDGGVAEKADLASSYQELLAAARLPTQVTEIAKKLRELDVEISLLKHLGFLPEWQICGKFENKDGVGFATGYSPESDFSAGKLNTRASYNGKDGDVKWQEISTEADDGAIDLNPVFENAKGAVVYATTTFNAATNTTCEIRIGSPNACKVWINGKQVISREVYHTGSQIDQYTAPCELKQGENSILVKLCQNEQTEPWAQEWMFQLRFTDSTGLAIQPTN